MPTVKPQGRRAYRVRQFELPGPGAPVTAKPRELQGFVVHARTIDDAERQARAQIRAAGRRERVISNSALAQDELIAYLFHPQIGGPDAVRRAQVRAPRDTKLTPAQLNPALRRNRGATD